MGSRGKRAGSNTGSRGVAALAEGTRMPTAPVAYSAIAPDRGDHVSDGEWPGREIACFNPIAGGRFDSRGMLEAISTKSSAVLGREIEFPDHSSPDG